MRSMGKTIGVIVVGYCLIGGLIHLTQLGLSSLFTPPCNGIIVQTLWADVPRRRDDNARLQDRLEGKPDSSLIVDIFRLGRVLVRWLPDLYQEVLAGDMTVRNYLLGGFQCYTGFPLPYDVPPGATKASGKTSGAETDITTHDVWQGDKAQGVRQP